MQNAKFQEWHIQTEKCNNGWLNIRCKRELESKSKTIVKKQNGGFATVKNGIKKYWLGWNGIRFAANKDYEIIQKRHRLLFEFICKTFCK